MRKFIKMVMLRVVALLWSQMWSQLKKEQWGIFRNIYEIDNLSSSSSASLYIVKQDLIKNTPLRVCHPGLMIIRLTSDNSPGISSTRSLLTPLELKHPLLHSTFANLFLVCLHILQCHVEHFWKFSAFSSLPGWSRDIVNWMVVSSYQHFA